jgi:glycosyltransferase A (GT-A) superfamily protein (DUF2064 family)
MRTAIAESDSPGGTLVIGTDCPALTTTHLREAAAQLAVHDAVLYPAEDGGYVLIGLHTAAAEIFTDMPWGSTQVMARTRERLGGLGWRWSEPATLWDIDRPEDLPRLLATWPEAAEALR